MFKKYVLKNVVCLKDVVCLKRCFKLNKVNCFATTLLCDCHFSRKTERMFRPSLGFPVSAFLFLL